MSEGRSSILVTGGCGFIGSNFVVKLLEKGYQVRVLDNLLVGRREYIPADVDLVVGDIRDENLVSQTVAGVDVVVHLAAHTNVIESIERHQLDFDVNVRGTFSLLHQCIECNVEKFVFASSNAAVGEQEQPITESSVPAPLSPYGASKLSAEAFCSAFSGSYGLQTIVLRFANVYGPRSSHKESVVAKFFGQALSHQQLTIYGDGNQTRDFIYVDDICQAILLSIENDSATGVFQVGTGVETKIVHLAKQIVNIANPGLSIAFDEARGGEIIRNYSSIEKARGVLGFEPQIDLDDGLVRTYDWFKREYAY